MAATFEAPRWRVIEIAVSVEQTRRLWLQALAAHARAADAHAQAAVLFAELGDEAKALAESKCAAIERGMHATMLARHPEWADSAKAPAVAKAPVRSSG